METQTADTVSSASETAKPLALRVTGLSKRFAVGVARADNFRDEMVQKIGGLFGKNGPQSETRWFNALEDISFELHRGEVLGIIGKNGAGKTTLLKILSEITPPTTGKIEYFGKFTSILEIGTGFHPDLTGRENIYLNGEILGMSRKQLDARFEEIVDFSGVREFIDSPVKHFSSGMYLRLAFSVAFHSEIDILILDEVLAVGDAEFRMKSFNKIHDLAQAGSTIILVSHGVNDILGLSTRCMLLEKGRIKALGKPQEIMENYIEATLKAAKAKEKQEAEEKEAKNEVSEEEKHAGTVKLHSAVVFPGGGNSEDPVHIKDDIHFEFEFEKMRPENTIELIMHLSDMSGAPIMVDSYALRPDYAPPEMPVGKYHAHCVIPGGWLNRGVYSLHVTFAENTDTPFLTLHNVLDFKIHLNPGNVKNRWNDQINSILRHQLDWKVEPK